MDICLNDIKHCFSYINLKKSIFTKHELMLIENDATKINYFYDYVLPSLSVQIYMPSNEIETVSMILRWVCYCPGCFDNQISFKKQNDFIQHLLTKHSHLIPKGFLFLLVRGFLRILLAAFIGPSFKSHDLVVYILFEFLNL